VRSQEPVCSRGFVLFGAAMVALAIGRRPAGSAAWARSARSRC